MTLSPSDRVRIISEIGQRLGTAEWAHIDLTLRQFRLPWDDDWRNDDRQIYVMRMIENGNDDVLLSLGEHLGFEFLAPQSRMRPGLWKKDYFRLFVSHLATHRRFATEVQDELLRFGVSSFVAHNDIEPALEWQNEMGVALFRRRPKQFCQRRQAGVLEGTWTRRGVVRRSGGGRWSAEGGGPYAVNELWVVALIGERQVQPGATVRRSTGPMPTGPFR